MFHSCHSWQVKLKGAIVLNETELNEVTPAILVEQDRYKDSACYWCELPLVATCSPVYECM